jgi:2-amino-4-hydroxy-6-hydroxymethyldihydropteridine diphosphokinase
MEGALQRLGHLEAVSSLYRTAPVGGPPDQPDYLNAVAQMNWEDSPFDLLGWINRIEADFGRVRAVRFGPRTLDIDILEIPGLVVQTERLTIPHPRIAGRAFVLVPLAQIDKRLAARYGFGGGHVDGVEELARYDSRLRSWVMPASPMGETVDY